MSGLRSVFIVGAAVLLISCGEDNLSGVNSFNRGVTDDEIIFGSFSDLFRLLLAPMSACVNARLNRNE